MCVLAFRICVLLTLLFKIHLAAKQWQQMAGK